MGDAYSAAARSRENVELVCEVEDAEFNFLANPSNENFNILRKAVGNAENESSPGIWGDGGLRGILKEFNRRYGGKAKEIEENGKTFITSDEIAQYLTRRYRLFIKMGEQVPILYTLSELISIRRGVETKEIKDELESKISVKDYNEIKMKIYDDVLIGKDIERIVIGYLDFPIKPLYLKH